MRILFLTPYPDLAPSFRTRVIQYLPYLRARGIDGTIQSFLSERGFRGQRAHRLVDVAAGTLRRLTALLQADRYDLVFVHREALPFPTAIVERSLRRLVGRLIFDFDDATYMSPPCDPLYLAQSHTISWGARLLRYPALRWLRSAHKFGEIVAAANVVMAGNSHLASHAKVYNQAVTVVPTAVDTDRIIPRQDDHGNTSIRIGWMGSPSTAPYLDAIAPALRNVLAAHPSVEFQMIGASWPPLSSLDRVGSQAWAFAREAADLASFDIGLMPLPDNEWTRGKCGYKALQYMSAAVPVVSSPVGVATEIISHAENGLLADSSGDWAECLTSLIEDAALRARLGNAGRETAESRYSAHVWGPKLADALLTIGS